MSFIEVMCQSCGCSFQRPIQRGRPAVRCETCRQNPNVQHIQSSNSKTIVPSAPQENIENQEIKVTTSHTKSKYDINVAHLYRVMVGNLGLAFAGNDEKEARAHFLSYSKKSQQGFGQVGFEQVQLWKLNPTALQYEIINNFVPDRSP